MRPDIHLYQIAYDEESAKLVQASGFLLLDNMANQRPDWYEYWPIRRFLLNGQMDESALYGFFSPKFTAKTGLSKTDVEGFIASELAKSPIDVALFCPQPDMGANFLNVFEQAEVFDNGFIEATSEFLKLQSIEFPLNSVVMDTRQIVYSNYFVARPRFWRAWFALTEALFGIAEDVNHPLHQSINHRTNYPNNASRKIFILERMASLLLTINPEFRVAAANPYGFGWSMTRFRESPDRTYINDALKRAYRDTGFPQYIDAFKNLRAELLQPSQN